jgi:hypothetical protein
MAKARRALDELEDKLRADGVRIVEREPVDLDELWRAVRAANAQRELIRRRAAVDGELVAAGVTVRERMLTIAGAPELTPEHEFIAAASLYGATPSEIVAVLYPADCRDDRRLRRACARVRKTQERLRRERVVIAYQRV